MIGCSNGSVDNACVHRPRLSADLGYRSLVLGASVERGFARLQGTLVDRHSPMALVHNVLLIRVVPVKGPSWWVYSTALYFR